jgi:lysophospholipase L1-like esterase
MSATNKDLCPMQIAIRGFLGFCILGLWVGGASAQSLAPHAVSPDSQWEESIARFVAVDRDHAPKPGGVVFVGSSSIRLWNDLETSFRDAPVILKRGFGGSKMSDCTRYLDRLVIPYKPRLVLLYAGDNDLAEGGSPQDVLRNFVKFVEDIHKELPTTRIAYISIKPSPARAALIPRVRETNELIRRYIAVAHNLEFIDVFTPMLDASGLPRAELFRADALHLNGAGYALWKTIIAPHVR